MDTNTDGLEFNFTFNGSTGKVIPVESSDGSYLKIIDYGKGSSYDIIFVPVDVIQEAIEYLDSQERQYRYHTRLKINGVT